MAGIFPIVAVIWPGTIDRGLDGADAPVATGGLAAPKPVKNPAITVPAAAGWPGEFTSPFWFTTAALPCFTNSPGALALMLMEAVPAGAPFTVTPMLPAPAGTSKGI